MLLVTFAPIPLPDGYVIARIGFALVILAAAFEGSVMLSRIYCQSSISWKAPLKNKKNKQIYRVMMFLFGKFLPSTANIKARLP